MQRYLFTMMMLLLGMATMACSQEKLWVLECASGNWSDIDNLQRAMANSQVVLVGEQHDHEPGHRLELEILDLFWQTHGDVAVALEMFERDVQHIMDGYLQGEVSEKFFLANSRPWKNYQRDYRPLVEFARSLSLPVLAMNVPRRYAAFVAAGKEKALWQLPEAEKKFFSEQIDAPDGPYRNKFVHTMRGHATPEAMDRYYRAQCFKDDTMAKTLAESLTGRPDTRIVAYVGAFHCEEKMGVAEKLSRRLPATRILVVCIVPMAERPQQLEEYRQVADFVCFVPEKQ